MGGEKRKEGRETERDFFFLPVYKYYLPFLIVSKLSAQENMVQCELW